MVAKRIIRHITILLILTSSISCDQISKAIVRRKIVYEDRISLIDNYVTLTRVENRGAFLSLGNSLPQPVKIFLLSFLPLIVLIVLITIMLTRKNISAIKVFGLSLIVGGGLGNIYDRVVYGSVTDFLHIDFVLFQTGIFNMADMSIMVGVFLIAGERLFRRKMRFHDH